MSDRRAELDALENLIKQREAVVAAAEMRLNERIAELKGLESKINALVEMKKAADDEQFKGLVSMYETMKPKAAAKVFDQLSSEVLYRVAIAMNPAQDGAGACRHGAGTRSGADHAHGCRTGRTEC